MPKLNSKTNKTEKPIVQELPLMQEPVAETPKLTKPQEDFLAKKLKLQAEMFKDRNISTGGGLGSEIKPPDFYPTGLPVFDNEVIGIGGLPKGRMIEVYGVKSSGKSALCMYLAGAVQRMNLTATVKMYDEERSFTPSWGKSMGLDLGRLHVVPTVSAEKLASMVMEDLSLGELGPNIIIIDSIAVMQPEIVMEKEIGDLSMRDNLARADFLTKFCNSMMGGFYWPPKTDNKDLPKDSKQISLADTQTTILCVNHAKQRTVKSGAKTYVEWYSVGGVALDFSAVMQLMVKRIGFREDSMGNISHQEINVKADKNKIAPPKRECELLLSFKGKIEQLGSIDWLSLAIEKGLAQRKGESSWIESLILLPNGKIQGAEAFNKYIEGNPDKKAVLTK
jgi:recombination protein RecA